MKLQKSHGSFKMNSDTWLFLRAKQGMLIIFYCLMAAIIFAQGQAHERVIVIRPGKSAVFHRHPSYRLPGGGFTLRYKFEGQDGVISRICDKIAQEREEWGQSEPGNELLEDASALRLEEELTRAAEEELYREQTASESISDLDVSSGSASAAPIENEKPASGDISPDAGIIIDNQ